MPSVEATSQSERGGKKKKKTADQLDRANSYSSYTQWHQITSQGHNEVKADCSATSIPPHSCKLPLML